MAIPPAPVGLFHPIRIGARVLPGNLALAPMAGATDPAFRRICREQGASLVCTELVSARGIRHDPGLARSWRYLEISPAESPVSIQLFGADPSDFDYAVHVILEHPVLSGLFAIDINMGCPVPKVVRAGGGCALMREPLLAARVIASAVRAAGSGASPVPVTVKFRTGWDSASADTPAFARMVQESGADALTIHARTGVMMYAGKADWDVITAVKGAVHIPVFGNGDADSGAACSAMLRQTGADGVAIGRAALGNPWIFTEASAAMRGEAAPPQPGIQARAAMVLRELSERIPRMGEVRAVREMRKSILWYMKGTPHASALRHRAAEATTGEEVRALMAEWQETAADFKNECQILHITQGSNVDTEKIQ